MPGGRLPRVDTELVILRVAAVRGSDYEFGHHSVLGRRAGLIPCRHRARARRLRRRTGGRRASRCCCGSPSRCWSSRDLDDDLWARLRGTARRAHVHRAAPARRPLRHARDHAAHPARAARRTQPMTGFTTRPTLTGTFGMVSSTHWLASQSAQRMLELGGNAFDAAVAGGFVLHVVEPHLNGPGGDLPAIVATAADPSPRVLCGQGPAPAAATREAFASLGLDHVPGSGPLAAAVPGAVDAWLLLLRDHGTLPLATVLEPAIGYARDGHPLIPRAAATIERVRELFESDWTTSADLWLPGGRAPRPGELFSQPGVRRRAGAARRRRRHRGDGRRAGPGGTRRLGSTASWPRPSSRSGPGSGVTPEGRCGRGWSAARTWPRTTPPGRLRPCTSGRACRSSRPGCGGRGRPCCRRWRCWTSSARRHSTPTPPRASTTSPRPGSW